MANNIHSLYTAEIKNILSLDINTTLEYAYWDPGFSKGRIPNNVTVATFNRCLTRFGGKDIKPQKYTETGRRGEVFNSYTNKLEFTHKYNVHLGTVYPVNLISYKTSFKDARGYNATPELVRDITEYTIVTNSENIIKLQIISEKYWFDRKWNISEKKYYVTLILKGNKVENIRNWQRENAVLLTYVQGTNFVYTLHQRMNLCNYYSTLLRVRSDPYTINKNVLVRARNLKLRDMRWGGLVGNSRTSYRVTPKADGVRRLLLLYDDSVWLVNPPYEFCLLLKITNNGLSDYMGSAFDCESLKNIHELKFDTLDKVHALDARNQNYPSSKYVVLVFDVLSYRDPNGIVSIDVQRGSKGTRLSNINVFLKHFTDWIESVRYTDLRTDVYTTTDYKNVSNVTSDYMDLIPMVTLKAKESLLFRTVSEFYTTMSLMFNTIQWFPIDGYMAEPDNMPYMTYNESGTLLNNASICKIKPVEQQTQDFALYRDDGVYVLYGGVSRMSAPHPNVLNHGLQRFVGTEINPFTPDMFDTTGVTHIPDGSIIETYYTGGNGGKLKFKHIRTNKDKPNNIDILNSIWNDIHRPIKTDTFLGNSDQLVRYYHNSIKRELFGNDNGDTLVDIGGGAGGSVNQYRKYRKVLVVEPNPDNIVELKRRLDNLKLNDKVRVVQAYGQDTSIITNAVSEWCGGQVDTVCTMMTLSFFWGSPESLASLVNTINYNLKPGGNFLYITIDGDVVQEMFRPQWLQPDPLIVNDVLTLGDIVTVKYYDGVNNESSDQSGGEGSSQPYIIIDIKNSLVNNQKEWLVHICDLETRLKEWNYVHNYKKRAIDEPFLSINERIFTSMYSYGTFTKKKADELKMSVYQTGSLPNINDTFRRETEELNKYYNEPVDFSKIRSPRPNLNMSPRRVTILPIVNPLLPVPTTLSDADEAVLNDIAISNREVSKITPIAYTSKRPLILPSRQNAVNNVKPVPIAQVQYVPPEINTVIPTSVISPPVLEFNPILPITTEFTDDDSVYTVKNDIVSIQCITGIRSFYHAVLKSFYPPYNTNNSVTIRNEIVNTLIDDIVKLLNIGDNITTLSNYDDMKYTIESASSLIRYEEPSAGNIRFLSETLNLGIVVVDSTLIPLYDFDSVAYNNRIYLIYDDTSTNYTTLGRRGLNGIVTVFNEALEM